MKKLNSEYHSFLQINGYPRQSPAKLLAELALVDSQFINQSNIQKLKDFKRKFEELS